MKTIEERRRSRYSQLHTIRTKIFLLRVGVGLAMSISIGVASFYSIKNYIWVEQEKALSQDALLIQDAITHHLEEHREHIEAIANSEQIKKYRTSSHEGLLHTYFKELGNQFTCLSYINEKGLEEGKVCRGEPSERLEDISADPNYITASQEQKKVVISEPRFIDALEDFALVFDYQGFDFFDQRTGFIRGLVSLSQIDEFVATVRVKLGDSIYITNDSGVFIRSPLASDLGSSAEDSNHYFHAIFVKSNGLDSYTGSVDMLNRQYKFAMASMPSMKWKIYVVSDLTELQKPVAKIRNFIIIIAVVLLVLGEVVSRSIGLKLTEPIAKLNALALSVVHSGRLSDRVEWQSLDELGELARSINLMLSRLENSQAALVEEKQFVENILTSMVGCLATVDAHGIIIKVNYELLELFGYHEEEILGQHYQTLFPAHCKPLTGSEKFIFVDQEVIRLDETLVVTMSGQEIPVNCTISTINDVDGNPRGLLFIINDIRDKKRLEGQRLAAEQKLRATQDDLLKTEKMAVVGQMAGMVAHEVLNPISAVNVRVDLSIKKGAELAKILEVLAKVVGDWQGQLAQGSFAEYFATAGSRDLALLDKIAKNLATRQAERNEDFQFIERQIVRVIKIIDGLREMSRTEKSLEMVPLVKLLTEVMDDMQDGIKKRAIVVETDYRSPSSVKADYMELYSIFSNIIKNAMQAIDKNKEAVERKIHITLDRNSEDQATVEISDTGIGMDEATRESIFSPGFTSKGRAGTGIGTSFSRKLARNYGGDIIVKATEPGKGSTFQVLLAIAGEKKND